ncbi:unnamed protein product [Lactuca virosa]|uniref:Uncharacterized protein n=1 Tax=Lactuca virosa TaxID=75947 RepID=A0AAU9MPD2_9ASTR|nr:unnamed protein product [Lactuca virosa]
MDLPRLPFSPGRIFSEARRAPLNFGCTSAVLSSSQNRSEENHLIRVLEEQNWQSASELPLISAQANCRLRRAISEECPLIKTTTQRRKP